MTGYLYFEKREKEVFKSMSILQNDHLMQKPENFENLRELKLCILEKLFQRRYGCCQDNCVSTKLELVKLSCERKFHKKTSIF